MHTRTRSARLLRALTITGLSLCIIGVTVSFWYSPMRPSLNDIAAGSRIFLTNLKLSGFTSDGRPYELTSARASQVLGSGNTLDLEQPRALLQLPDGRHLTARAATGVIIRDAGMLTLRKEVVLDTDDGNSTRFVEAVIDMNTSRVVSKTGEGK